ncbi:hypothetical protein GOP47_0022889 [Adiantum capillus-veneris]|uniref:BHLH domain-containing protein n=1 Tax=Adiantum capillus-veneris TaxID=13818 RepID=A0A9D4Z5Y8_ADICA|nr:hypothetical protein GOP47_0022889 [Adiantum capillus-veneris]
MLAPAPVGMCRVSQDQMENMNADQIDISLMQKAGSINNGSSCKASGDDQINGQREMNKQNNYKHSTQEEENQLPEELENVLHLSASSASDDSTSTAADQQTHPNYNSEAVLSEESTLIITSSPQSTIEHTQTNTHTNIQHDQNIMHANSEASLNDSNSCNSSTNMFSNLLLNGGGSMPVDIECSSTPFFSSSTRSSLPGASSIEEPTSFFSSSIVNESLTPDLSLMSSKSTSMPKSTPTLPAATEATHDDDHRTLPFFNESNHNMHLMEAAASFHHHKASLMMSDSVEYAHFNIPSYSSFLAESPSSCLPSERGYHHVDFLGTCSGDGNGAAGHECTSGMFHHEMRNYNSQQHIGDVDHATLLSYQNAHGSMHNALQQECITDQGAYAYYLGPHAQGMIPVMPMHGGTHTSKYMLNAMELQQAEDQYYHEHHQQAGGEHRHHLTHSHSLPLCLDQFGSTQQISLMESQRIEIAVLNGGAGGSGAEGFRPKALMTTASISSYGGAVRSRATQKSQELVSSGSSAMAEGGEDDGPWAHVEGQYITANAASWRASNHVIKGMTRHSNKRRSPKGEEEDENAPPLKRSVSWNCIGSMNNRIKQPMSRSNSSPLGSGVGIEHPHMMNMQLGNNGGSAAPISMNLKTNPVPLHQNTKQDKPRARQGIANDPQSIAARHRREKISERLKNLQQLVPNGSKVDLVTMLEKAINYVKFLQLQVKVLATDEYWPTPLNKFPKVAAMAKLATDSKEPTNLEKVEKALAMSIQANS